MPPRLDFPPFRPHPLLRSAHLQTIASAYFPGSVRPYQASQHVIELPDSDRLVLHDDCPPAWAPGQRAALLIHGLGGSHASGYMSRIADKLNGKGVRTFRLDMRGCGAGDGLAQKPCHGGRSEDAAAAITKIAALCPGSSITAIGFSLGGNIVLKLLGERPPAIMQHVDSAAAVSPPVDLEHCSRNLKLGWNRLYDQSFLRRMNYFVRRRRSLLAHLAEDFDRRPPRCLWDFDHRFTAPLSGYQSAEDYYENASAAPLLSQIDRPTLIISAADDPLIPVDMFERTPFSSAIALHVTSQGGHLGFYGAKGDDADRRWLDWRIVDWVTAQDKEQHRASAA